MERGWIHTFPSSGVLNLTTVPDFLLVTDLQAIYILQNTKPPWCLTQSVSNSQGMIYCVTSAVTYEGWWEESDANRQQHPADVPTSDRLLWPTLLYQANMNWMLLWWLYASLHWMPFTGQCMCACTYMTDSTVYLGQFSDDGDRGIQNVGLNSILMCLVSQRILWLINIFVTKFSHSVEIGLTYENGQMEISMKNLTALEG